MQGLTILSWMENLPKHELPAEYLWEDSKGLEMWWATVEERRKIDPTGRSTQDSDDDDHHSGPRMAENDYARALRAGG